MLKVVVCLEVGREKGREGGREGGREAEWADVQMHRHCERILSAWSHARTRAAESLHMLLRGEARRGWQPRSGVLPA